MSGNIDPEIRNKCASWRRSWLPYFLRLFRSCPVKMNLVSDLVKWISQSIENPSFESMYQWMTSRGNLGVLHKLCSMVWGNLGKKYNYLMWHHYVTYTSCIATNHELSWVTLRTSYYLQAVQCLPLYIIPVFRHVMLNGNAAKWLPLSLTCVFGMELIEEKLVTRQQKKLWVYIHSRCHQEKFWIWYVTLIRLSIKG